MLVCVYLYVLEYDDAATFGELFPSFERVQSAVDLSQINKITFSI